jgi:NAD(P)-dependent dehydrogenase (short-subunit alcohol dehydrogenase family)
MKTRHAGKVAIVTGGASGIGRALAEELARRGAEVVLADRQAELAAEVAEGIERDGGRARAAELDVRDAGAFRAVADDTLQRAGRIDFLFNNAGIAVGRAMDEFERADWDDVLDVNLRGVCYGVQAVYPTMVRQGCGHIVNTASVAGLIASGNMASYTASKHAVVGLSKALRLEAAAHGVRASVLCPGVIRTPILSGGRFGRIQLPAEGIERIEQLWERYKPMGPEDFAPRALDEVEGNVAFIVVPRWWKVLWYLERAAPAASLKLWTWAHERIRDELLDAEQRD